MTTLNLAGLPVDLPALNVVAERQGFSHGSLLDEGLVLHHLLGESFGKGALQPFRLMPARGGRTAMLYAYSRRSPDELADTAATVALPDIETVLQLSALQARPMPGRRFTPGKRLGFDIRLRPVLRARAGPHSRNAGAERDVFQARAEQSFPGRKRAMAAAGETREAVYLDWLQARLGDAADIDRDATHLARFQRRRVLRGGQVVEGPDAVFHGTLEIRDSAQFLDRLARGVGRHRAYGYGMLLLRPPRTC